MIIFHCDLDNTLIYSYKRDIGAHKTCVEMYQQREISYMTHQAMELLSKLREKVLLVPTTTRTAQQYHRIDLGYKPPYALVCNGGVLLHEGAVVEDWYAQSLALVAEARPAMLTGMELLQQDQNRSFELRWIEHLFVFTKSDKPEETVAYLREKLPGETVEVLQNGTKIYIVPRALSKGVAVERFRRRMNPQVVFAAGDSEFDIPMLCASDYAYAPCALFDGQTGNIPAHIRRLPDPFDQNFMAELLKHPLLANEEEIIC